jgi:hypothetical protein
MAERDAGSWLLPTPRHEGHDTVPHRGQPDSLHSYAKMFPSPQHHDHHPGYAHRVGRYGTKHGGKNLNDEVAAMLPTPAASDHKGSSQEGQHRGQLSEVVTGMKLSAAWVCRMQGFPDNWLDVD